MIGADPEEINKLAFYMGFVVAALSEKKVVEALVSDGAKKADIEEAVTRLMRIAEVFYSNEGR